VTLRARFSPNSEDAAPSIEWLSKSGVAAVSSWQEVHDLGVVEIQLRETPPVLAYLSQLEDTVSISRITSEGIVFYLTDVPLWHGVPESRRKVTSERTDGFLFVPMSNVVCINAFGSVYGPHTGA
jgi:hypothetical protein